MKFQSNSIFNGTITANSVADAGTNTDKFLVLNSSGLVTYRTGAELYADLGIGSLPAGYTSTLKHEVKAGETLSKGMAVYVSSADGTNMIVSKASNAAEATSSKTMGLLETDLSINGKGNVITEGLLAGLDTTGATNAGDPVWLGTGGNLLYGLANKPVAPAHMVFIGIVTRINANNGEIFVKVQNGFEMGELHNYAESGVANNDVITWESSTSLYKPKSIATILGYTPANAATTISTTAPLQGGGDLSVNRTFSITQAGAASNGYLSSTDWNTFNNKQSALTNPVTGTGTTNYLSKFTGTSAIGNSLLYDNGTGVIIGGTNALAVAGTTYLSIQNNTLTNSRGIGFYCADGTQNPRAWIKHTTDSGIQYLAFDSTWSTSNGYANFAFLNGKVLINTTTDAGYKLDVNGTSRFVDNAIFDSSVAIGLSTLAQYALRINKNIAGSVTSYGISIDGTIQSDVTSVARFFHSAPTTQATTFTLSSLQHFVAGTTTIGAGSTVTNQFGFLVLATAIGATNNYAFNGQLAAATNTWNLYMVGTAPNYMNGSLSIGTTTSTGYRLIVGGTITGSTTSYGVYSNGTIQSDVTSAAYMYRASPITATTSFTLTNLFNFHSSAGTLGIGSTVTNHYGYYVDALSIGINNYGFYGAVAAGTGRWNLFMNGTANNYIAGNTGIGNSANFVGAGPILTTTLTNGGSGYVDGTYTDVAATNISSNGVYALFTIVVSGGIVTTATLTWGGTTYREGDTVTVSNTLLGGTGSGLIITVSTVDSSILTIASATGGDITLFRNDTTLSVGDNIGSIKWMNNDSTIKASGLMAEIGAFGTSTNGGAYLSFLTRSGTAGTSLVEALRISEGGSVGIGATTLTGYSLRVSKNITGSTSSFGIINDGQVQSGVTTQATYIQSSASTVAASFTIGTIRHFRALQGTFGLGSTVTNQYGYEVDSSLVGATNNYGFYGDIPSGTGRWNIYMTGSAANYMAGKLLIGSPTDIPSASVAITSTTQGFLPPRMTLAQRTAISSPATGLIVYQTDGVEGLWLNTSAGWRELTVV